MSKAVLISIRPKWCEKIINGEKTIDVRKTRPKIEPPFKCYIYCTTNGKYLNIPISRKRFLEDYKINGMQSMNHPIGNGKVIGEFVCDRVHKFSTVVYLGEEQTITDDDVVKQSCVSRPELREYETTEPPYGLYGWHVLDLKIYDKPKELTAFKRPCTTEQPCALCRHAELHPDGMLMCENRVFSPPQSWCYVEEIQ